MFTDNIPIIIAIVILVILSAYFSATETAFTSLNKTRLRSIAEKGNRRAKVALKLSEDYNRLLSTILIGNNIVNIAAASLGTVLFVELYGDIGATLSTVVLTIVVLIFGEISPKSIANDRPEQFAMFSAPILNVLIVFFTPLNFLFSCWKKVLARIFHLESNKKMSQEELLMFVDEVQQSGSIDQDEGELLRSALEFSERTADDILTHRVNLTAAPVDISCEELAKLFSETKFSRIPVYEDNIDDIVGVVHLKDLYDGASLVNVPVRSIMGPVVFIMRNDCIDNILKRLQRSKSHVAVVLDEYGGTYGIVTMEDILEELVGEIWDEHDDVIEEISEIRPGLYRANGLAEFEDFKRFFGVDSESEMTSLSGWVTEQLGRIPEPGERVECCGLSIEISAVEHNRITSMLINSAPVATNA